MTDQDLHDLLKKYNEGRCTQEEKLLLYNWYNKLDASSVDFKPQADYEQVRQRTWDKLKRERLGGSHAASFKLIRYWPVAAAIAVLAGISALYVLYNPRQQQDNYTYNKAHDVAAGSNKAILTLANGNQIILDDAKAGTIAQQGSVSVSKNKNGQLVYTILEAGSVGDNDKENRYNTISTPNGGQYQVILPDGSLVYLNAASSLKYPLKFTSDERMVSLTGEGYFEITKNAKRPFIVKTINQTVKVIGTHFNVSCYADELTKTTLVEGKVLVSLPSDNDHQTLKPGQQATIIGNSLQIKEVNAEDEVAWKDGLFVFRNSTIKSVLQRVCRWYDVQVDYSTLPEKHFDGEIPRDRPLSEVLIVIEKTNHVNLKIVGNTILVKK